MRERAPSDERTCNPHGLPSSGGESLVKPLSFHGQKHAEIASTQQGPFSKKTGREGGKETGTIHFPSAFRPDADTLSGNEGHHVNQRQKLRPAMMFADCLGSLLTFTAPKIVVF